MTIGQKINYYVLIFCFRIVSFIPSKILFVLSELITFLVYRVIAYRRTVVIKNLKASFPEKTSKEITQIARKYFRHLSVMMVENILLRFVSDKQFEKMLILENKALFEDYYTQKKNLIIMLGHYGNWEFGAGITRLISYKGAAVYKKLSNKAFDKIYFEIRERLGVEPVEMHNVFRRTVDLIKDEPFLLFMVADQSPMKGDKQEWIHFLNQDTGVYTGSEKLAKKFDMPVIYLEMKRIKKGSYKIVPHLLCDKPQETAPNEITEGFYKALEKTIQDGPRFWLWSHRRWKNKPTDKPA